MSIDMKEELETRKAVLVVDDSDQICRMMKRRLAPFFEKVFTAGDPEEATQILEEHEVSHILCDFDLGRHRGGGCDRPSLCEAVAPGVSQCRAGGDLHGWGYGQPATAGGGGRGGVQGGRARGRGGGAALRGPGVTEVKQHASQARAPPAASAL